MGCDVRKPVFGVSDNERFIPSCKTTETISLVASLVMILSNKRLTNALIRLLGCTC